MNKKMREISTQIQAKTMEAKQLLDAGEMEKASTLMNEVDDLNKQFEIAKRVYEAEKMAGAESTEAPVETEKKSNEDSFAKAFKAIAKGVKLDKSLVEGVNEDGGYTVPEDVNTLINQFKKVDYSLADEIDIEKVSTNKGSRTYQSKGSAGTFVDLDEDGAMDDDFEIDSMKFERIPFSIQDRAGFMPVSNDLINDSDANIREAVAKWLGESDVATTNAKVLGLVAGKEAVEFEGIKDMKTALNVTLGQAYKAGAKIYTNDDGLNYLDTLEDGVGRPLLNPDPTAPASLQLRCGTTILPVKVIPNSILETKSKKIPFIIGNLFDYVKKFDRQSITLDASTSAVIGKFNAYAKNMTLIRAIVRDDYRVKDAGSIVNGYVEGE